MIAIKVKSTNRSGEGGEELLCDPGSELRPGGREKRRTKIINGMKNNNHNNNNTKEMRSKYIPNFVFATWYQVYIWYTTICDTGGRTSLRSIPPVRSTSWRHV